MAEPRASRPSAPDWLGGDELIPWSWAVEQLTKERNYWLVSVRSDGFPQSRPLWGVWLGDQLFLSVGHAGLQRAVRSQGVTVHVDSAVDVVILEGTIEKVTQPPSDRAKRAGELYEKKYEYSADFINFVVRPRLVYGWKAEDVKTATKWSFD